MNFAIETKNLTRTHKDVKALDAVNIKIRANKITGLLGRNGAGKTTFMSLVTAQDQPTKGEIFVSGQKPFENAGVLEQMCFIRDNQRYPDDYKLKHALQAAAIFFPNWDAAFAEELVAVFNIPTKPIIKKFSRGQFSALGIVLSLASRAPITFFDEPYLGLDATARAKFYEILISDYNAHPRTIVLSTHLINEMDQILERVIILDNGRVAKDIDVDELRGISHKATGRVADVDNYIEDKKVLSYQKIGGLATAVVDRPFSSDQHNQIHNDPAINSGIEISAVSLQELVAAYGLEGTERVGA